MIDQASCTLVCFLLQGNRLSPHHCPAPAPFPHPCPLLSNLAPPPPLTPAPALPLHLPPTWPCSAALLAVSLHVSEYCDTLRAEGAPQPMGWRTRVDGQQVAQVRRKGEGIAGG